MLRASICALLVSVTTPAVAGQRCIQQKPPSEPPLVFYSDAADVHADHRWHRTPKPGGPEKAGKLSPAAFERFVAFRRSGPSDAATIACLDALIADERGPGCTAK